MKQILHTSRSLALAFLKIFNSQISNSVRNLKLRKTIVGLSAMSSAFVLLLTLPNLSPANAVVIRSANTDGCTVDIGTAGAATISKNGNNCVVTVTSNTSVTLPSYVNNIGVIAVGGGGGGGGDGGSGGGGGEVRWSTAQSVAAGSTITINIGAGGNGGSWFSSTVGSNGAQTTISGGGLSYSANGGTGGGGWTTTSGGAGGTGGSGGSNSAQGARGGGGPGNCPVDYNWYVGTAGSSGTSFASGQFGASTNSYAGGGGGGAAGQMYNTGSAVLGAAGGTGGGGRGSNYKYSASDGTTSINGASPGQAGTANSGGGGGGGSACNAYANMASGIDGVYQRTAGGNGGSGVAVFSFVENLLAVTQNLDGCTANLTEVCLVPALVQIRDDSSTNISRSGVSVTVTASPGTAAGVTTAATNAAGLATFDGLYITGSSVGTTITLTFEAVGYRNIQQTMTLKAYADKLSVVSGSTDTTGGFVGTTGVWMSTSTNSSVSVTTLNSQLGLRDVTLRAHSATVSESRGFIEFAAGAAVNSPSATARTLKLRASQNIYLLATSSITSSTQPINVIFNSNWDNSLGGAVRIYGSASGHALNTKGGHVSVGGGSAQTSWSGLEIPSGYATGDSPNTGAWWGAEIYGPGQNLPFIQTEGGNLRVYGATTAQASNASFNEVRSVYLDSAKIDLGAGTFNVWATSASAMHTATYVNSAIGLTNSKLIATGGITLGGTTSAAGTAQLIRLSGTNDLDAGSSGNVTLLLQGATGSMKLENTLNVTGNLSIYASQTTSNISGAINATGNITATDSNSITTSASITAAGNIALTADAGALSIGGNLTSTGASKKITLKATGNVSTTAAVTIQSNAGNIVFWSNSDKVAGVAGDGGQVYLASNTSLNSQGGGIYLGGGRDDGGTDSGIPAMNGWSSMAAGDGLPDGFGNGNNVANQNPGVHLDSGYSLRSNGGDIFIAGQDSTTNANSGTSANVIFHSGTIDSGTGRIGVWGKSSAQSLGVWSYGIYLHGVTADNVNARSIWHSANRTARAITIYGDSSANTSLYAHGVTATNYSTLDSQWGYNSFHLLASGLKDSADLANKPGGGISITGIGSTTTNSQGNGIVWQWADAIAKDGPISMNGFSNDSTGSYQSAGIYFGVQNPSSNTRLGAMSTLAATSAKTYTTANNGTVDFTTSSSDITLTATKFVFFEFNSEVTNAGYRFNTTGNVTIQSWGSTFTSNQNTTHWQFGRISILGNPRNVTIGKPTDTTWYYWHHGFSATGAIAFYADKVWFYNTPRDGAAKVIFNTSLASSGTATPNIGFTAKMKDRIWFQTNVSVTTSGSDISMWSDSDSNSAGAQYYEASNVFTSNGGDITMGGGLDDGGTAAPDLAGRVAGDNHPDGYAHGVSGWGANAGIDLLGSYELLSGGGDISLAGRGSNIVADDDYGVLLRGGMIFSGAGRIDVFAKAPDSTCNSYWHRGIATGWSGDGGVSTYIISNSTSPSAINFYSDMSGCVAGSYSNAIQSYHSAQTYYVTPNGGGIKLTGIQGNATFAQGSWANGDYQESNVFTLNYSNLISNTGLIELRASWPTSAQGLQAIAFNRRQNTGSQVNNIGSLPTARSTGFAAYPTIAATASSSDVKFAGDSVSLRDIYLRNTGDLTIEPTSSTFKEEQFFSVGTANLNFSSAYKNVRIGKAGTNGSTQTSSKMTIDRISATGDVEVYGGEVILVGGLTTSATSGKGVFVKATGDITVSSGTSANRNPLSVTGTNSTAPLTLWSNADATGGGSISIGNYVDVATRGADIVFGGSAAASDTSAGSYADGVNAGTCDGVRLGSSAVANGSVTVTSNGGNITMRGRNSLNAGSCMGIKVWTGTAINSGVGAILLDGVSVAPSGGNNGHGVELNWTGGYNTTLSSAKVSGTAISITGRSNGTSTNGRGIVEWTGSASSRTTISATAGGDISLVGSPSSGSTTAITLNYTDIYANGGSITLDGGSQQVRLAEDRESNTMGGSSANSR